MKRFLVLSCLSALAGSAFAGDPMVMVRERAKETSQAVSAGQPPPGRAAAPAQNIPPPPNPALIAMQKNVASLAGDLAALQADPLKKQPLINDLNAAAQGISPSKASVEKLASDLGTALSGKKLSPEPCAKIAQYLRAFFNSSHVTPAQQRTILDDLQKLLSSAGVTADNAARVVADFKAIAAEVK